MTLNTSAPIDHVISLPRLLAVVMAATGLAYLMTPSQDELSSTLDRDRLGADLLPMLRENWSDPSRSVSTAMSAVSSARLGQLSAITRLTARERVRLLLSPRGLDEFDSFSEAIVLGAIRYVDVMKSQDAYALIEPATAKLPARAAVNLLARVGENALAEGNVQLASTALIKASALPEATWEHVQKMMQACQWAGRAEDAVAVCQNWLGQHQRELTARQRSAAQSAIEDLALGASMPDQAFEMVLRELQARPSIAFEDGALVEKCRQTATYAGRSKEALPWIEVYLTTMPLATVSVDALLALPRPLSAEAANYVEWLRRAAQVADWNGLAVNAYRHHSRLVALGEMASLDRLIALTASTGFGLETAALLKAIGPIEGREYVTPLLARLWAQNGEIAEARQLYERWTAQHPHDQMARYELVNLIRGTESNETALAAFEAFVHDFPKHDAAVKRLAELRLRLARNAAALDALDTLPDDALDPDTLENYVSLAESEERVPSLVRGLRLMLAQDSTDKLDAFDRLQEVYCGAGDLNAALAVLQEATTALPDRPGPWIKLGNLLLEMGRPADALEAVLRPKLLRRADGAGIALAALRVDESRAPEVLEALGPDAERTVAASLDSRINLAIACGNCGQAARADAILKSIPASRENLALLAEAHLALQEYQIAEGLAEQNIALNEPALPRDWVLLGDARSKAGREPEARQAYQRALEGLMENLHSIKPISAQFGGP